jgi:hypothetical protein
LVDWKRWTEQEKQYLIENYPIEDMEKMMNHLERSESAIVLQAHSLDLKRRAGYSVFQRIIENQKKLMKQVELKSVTIIFFVIINLVNGCNDFSGLNF